MAIGNVGKKRPSHIFGRGLVEIEDEGIFEFQTAKITEDEQLIEFLNQMSKKMRDFYKYKATKKVLHIGLFL